MPTTTVRALSVALALAVVPNAFAQSTVFLVMPGEPGGPSNCVGQLLTLDLDTPRLLASVAVPRSCEVRNDAPYASPDGRFLVWSASDAMSLARQLTVFDTVTGAGTVAAIHLERIPILGNPARPEVFVGDSAGPFAWSAAGERRFACPACSGLTSVMSLSADGSRVAFRAGPIIVFDSTSGAPISTLALPGQVALDTDGDVLFHATGTTLERYDVATGARLGVVTLPFAPFQLAVDPRTGELFVLGDADLQVHDPTTLQKVRGRPAPWLQQFRNSFGFSWTFDPARPRAYSTSTYTVQPGTPHNQYFVLDTATLGVVLENDIPLARFILPGRFVVAAHPAPPLSLQAAVQGDRVQLTWTAGGPPASITRYLLDVGSAAGLGDLLNGLDLGLQTSLAAAGVPPGRYHVRVRAANHAGVSAPSNEVVVQVP